MAIYWQWSEKISIEPKEEYVIPENPNDVILEPRLGINNVVESSDEILDEEFPEEMIELRTSLIWEEMMKFADEKAEEMRRAEIVYENWLKKIREWPGLDSESDSEWLGALMMTIEVLMMLMVALMTLMTCKF